MYNLKLTPLLLFLLFVSILVISVVFGSQTLLEGHEGLRYPYTGISGLNAINAIPACGTTVGNVRTPECRLYNNMVSTGIPICQQTVNGNLLTYPCGIDITSLGSNFDYDALLNSIELPDGSTVTHGNQHHDNNNRNGNEQVTDSAISEYFKWYWYWKSNEQQPSDSQYMNNYMLKTQFVPPVCQSCPLCTNDGIVCSYCGGTGGCGTLSNQGTTVVKEKENEKDKKGSLSKVVDSAGNVIETTVDTAGNVVIKTVDTAGNVVNKTVDAAGNIINKTIDTAGNVLGKVEDKVSGLFESNQTNVRDNNNNNNNRYSDNSNSKNNNRNQVFDNTGYKGTQNSNPDNYSYYGAVQSKTGNFLPVTTDFSAFRK